MLSYWMSKEIVPGALNPRIIQIIRFLLKNNISDIMVTLGNQSIPQEILSIKYVPIQPLLWKYCHISPTSSSINFLIFT